jgi:hypothetical protein
VRHGEETTEKIKTKLTSTCLVFRIVREILAVEMRGQNDAPRRVWVFRRDDVCEGLWTVWRHGYETVLFYMPVEIAERGGEVVADKCVIFGFGWTSVGF